MKYSWNFEQDFKAFMQMTKFKNAQRALFKHPREWIPPPCRTSPPQKRCYQENVSNYPQISHSTNTNSLEMTEADRTLKSLRKERKILKEAQENIKLKESLSPSLKTLVLKWKSYNKSRSQDLGNTNLVNEKQKLTHQISFNKFKENASMEDLERSFVLAQQEEKRLQTELDNLKKAKRLSIRKNKSNLKSKKCRKCRYKYIAMRRKQKDLLSYLTKMEGDAFALRRQNEALKEALKQRNVDLVDMRNKVPSDIERINTTRNQDIKSIKFNKEKDSSRSQLDNRTEKDSPYFNNNNNDNQNNNKQYNRYTEPEFENLNTNGDKIHTYKPNYDRFGDIENTLRLGESVETYLDELAPNTLNSGEKTGLYLDELEPGNTSLHINEDKWLVRLREMRDVYERTILGYKEELQVAMASNTSTEERLRSVIVEYERREKDLTNNYEIKFNALKFKLLMRNNNMGESHTSINENYSSEALKLRAILADKNKEIENLRNNTRKITEYEEIFRRNFEQIGIDISSISSDKSLYDIFYSVINRHWNEIGPNVKRLMQPEDSFISNKEHLDQENSEVCGAVHEVQDTPERPDQITHGHSRLESRNSDSFNKKTEETNELLRSKISLLLLEIDEKNKILETNSKQLEIRIREYSYLSSQLERIKTDHSKEILRLKSLVAESTLKPSIRELNLQKDKLQYQLSFLKKDKELSDRNYHKQIRSLESQISNLKIQNSTLKMRLERIQSSYDILFQSVGNLPNFVSVVSGGVQEPSFYPYFSSQMGFGTPQN